MTCLHHLGTSLASVDFGGDVVAGTTVSVHVLAEHLRVLGGGHTGGGDVHLGAQAMRAGRGVLAQLDEAAGVVVGCSPADLRRAFAVYPVVPQLAALG